MTALASTRSVYVPITPRRRVVSIVMVALLYLVAAILLINLDGITPSRSIGDDPIIVTLLTQPAPPEPNASAPPKTEPSIIAGNGPELAKPTLVAVDVPSRLMIPSPTSAPSPAMIAATPLPSMPDLTLPPDEAPAAMSNPGGGDRIDNGAGGTGEGGTGAGGNNGRGGGGSRRPRWLHQVTNDELMPLLPPSLRTRTFSADFLMQCEVARTTQVVCRVARETPYHAGLRDAVLAAVPLIRIDPGSRGGVVADGQRVQFLWRITLRQGSLSLR